MLIDKAKRKPIGKEWGPNSFSSTFTCYFCSEQFKKDYRLVNQNQQLKIVLENLGTFMNLSGVSFGTPFGTSFGTSSGTPFGTPSGPLLALLWLFGPLQTFWTPLGFWDTFRPLEPLQDLGSLQAFGTLQLNHKHEPLEIMRSKLVTICLNLP